MGEKNASRVYSAVLPLHHSSYTTPSFGVSRPHSHFHSLTLYPSMLSSPRPSPPPSHLPSLPLSIPPPLPPSLPPSLFPSLLPFPTSFPSSLTSSHLHSLPPSFPSLLPFRLFLAPDDPPFPPLSVPTSNLPISLLTSFPSNPHPPFPLSPPPPPLQTCGFYAGQEACHFNMEQHTCALMCNPSE